MNHLSFEFMERTKSVASSPHKTQSLYRMKSIIVLVWIFAFHFYTSFVFFAGFVAFAGSGLTLLLALSKEKKTISQKWEEIFFLLVAYCFLPFSSTVGVYVLTVCLLLWIMEYLFIYLNGYFIHPVILVLLFLSVCLPGVFESYSKAQIFNFYPSFSGYFFYSFSVSGASEIFYKDFFTAGFGLFAYSPAIFLGIAGFVIYLLPFVPRLVYKTAFLYFTGICVFSYFVVLFNFFLYQEWTSIWVLYKNFICNLMLTTPVVFTGLFVIAEPLGNPLLFRYPILFALFSSIFTVVAFDLGVGACSSLLGVLMSYILFFIVQLNLVNSYRQVEK